MTHERLRNTVLGYGQTLFNKTIQHASVKELNNTLDALQLWNSTRYSKRMPVHVKPRYLDYC